jgi:predicted CXXCH cytochrome family protein
MPGHLNKFVSIIFRSIGIYLCIMSFSIIPSVVQAEIEETRKIWSSGAHLTWVGGKSLSPGSLSITLNGNPVVSKKITINDYTGLVHVRMPLEYNMSNLITIKDGNNILFNGDVFYAPTYEEEFVPEDYKPNPFHIEKNEKPCLVCHRLRIKESDKMPGKPAEKICFPCHNEKFSDLQFLHRAAGINWDCLRCHQSEALETDYSTDSPVKFIIKEGSEVAPLCYQCHKEEKKKYSENEYVHSPIAMDMCNMCHNPHGSNYKKFMQKKISSICIECHEMQDVMEKANVHEPVLHKGCPVCHNPHGSNFPFFLGAEINGSCFECHPKTERRIREHPVNHHPISGPKDPLDPAKPLSCVSCHNPHSSEYARLLAKEEIMMLCIKCHPVGEK